MTTTTTTTTVTTTITTTPFTKSKRNQTQQALNSGNARAANAGASQIQEEANAVRFNANWHSECRSEPNLVRTRRRKTQSQ